jgi:hypothetical protein
LLSKSPLSHENFELKENKETKVRDEGGNGVQGDERKERRRRSQGVLRRTIIKKASLELLISLELRF